jgi:hypothetical protein
MWNHVRPITNQTKLLRFQTIYPISNKPLPEEETSWELPVFFRINKSNISLRLTGKWSLFKPRDNVEWIRLPRLGSLLDIGLLTALRPLVF